MATSEAKAIYKAAGRDGRDGQWRAEDGAGPGTISGTWAAQGAVRGALERAGLQHHALGSANGAIDELRRIGGLDRPGPSEDGTIQAVPEPGRRPMEQ